LKMSAMPVLSPALWYQGRYEVATRRSVSMISGS
jgi:hypothetical protein